MKLFHNPSVKTMMNGLLALTLLVFLSLTIQAQSGDEQIREAVKGYIVGTAYNESDQVKSAFMPGAMMFLDHPEKPLFVRTIEEYAERLAKNNPGKFNGRTTNILSIDHFEGIATVKLEVLIPGLKRRFIDLLLLKRLEDGWKIISKTAASEVSNQSVESVLLVLSSTTRQGTSDLPAGNSFSEVVIAYNGYQKAGYHVDLVTPLGGRAPLVYIDPADSLQLRYLYDADFMYTLEHTRKPEEIDPEAYRIIQFTGGSGPIFDVPQNEGIQRIAMEIYEKHQGVIAAVCHGTAGLVNLKTENGKYLVAGKNVNGVPNREESEALKHKTYDPFSIESVLRARGGDFRHSSRGKSHVEVAGRLITGQNYLSSAEVTRLSVEVSKTTQLPK